MLLAAAVTVLSFSQHLEPKIPQLSDRDRFPGLIVAKEERDRLLRLCHEGVKRMNLEPENADRIEAGLKPLRWRWNAWEQLVKCHEYEPKELRQRCLAELRQHIGDDAYYLGVIPTGPPPEPILPPKRIK